MPCISLQGAGTGFPSGSAYARISVLPYPGQMIAAVPVRRQRIHEAAQRFALRRVFGKREGLAPSQFQDFSITQRVGNVESLITMLPGAEKFARTTHA